MPDTSGSGARWLPCLATATAIILCYGTLALAALLSRTGLVVTLAEVPRAVSIGAFVAVALAGLARRRSRHADPMPFRTAVAGAALVAWALISAPGLAVELAGFALLVLAVWLDWRRGA